MDTVAELLMRAEAQGYLTTDDILDVLPEAENSLEQLEDIFIALQDLGIKVCESKEDLEDDVARHVGQNVYATAGELLVGPGSVRSGSVGLRHQVIHKAGRVGGE